MGKKIAVVSAIDSSFKFLLSAQIKAIKKAGFEVHTICTKGPNHDWLIKNGFLMYPVRIKRSLSPFSDLFAIWRMYKYFKRENITIVHTHFPKAGLLGQIAAKLARIPIIIHTLHGFYLHDNMKPMVKWFHTLLERLGSWCSTTILSQNPEDIETAVKLRICKRDKIKLLGNGVDLSKFDPDSFDTNFKQRKRDEIGVPKDAIVVCIIGRLVKEKGYLELYEAMRDVMAQDTNAWLIIIGPEEPEKMDRVLSDEFKVYGISNRTKYLGERYDIPELLACCNIYTLPSWREGFPRSAIEAAAMGLPIVATNIRGCRQVVEDGINGLLVPLKNSSALASAIKKLIADKELRLKMGQAGHEKARKEFDEKNVCEIVLEEYDQSLTKLRCKNR